MNNFTNEPVLDLRTLTERNRLRSALTELDGELPFSVPVMIGGSSRASEEIVSVDPGAPDKVVGQAASASTDEVERAVSTAAKAFPAWAATPAEERAAIVLKAAANLRRDRYALSALAVREAGKPWVDAGAEVCEAIDFAEYYSRNAIELSRGRSLVQVPGELNSLEYRPRGVAAVIAPWNFPLAIPNGMMVAALVTGNTVCLKPAEQSPACALRLVEALYEAGLPEGVLSLLPGEAETGQALVNHPRVGTIAFTGSGAVGLEIIRSAAELREGQRHLKRVIVEMGGKNCSIVDSDADLDDAVPAILGSAFGFGGQKCSATSRLLVHEGLADELIERISGALDTLKLGQAEEFDTDVPPLIEDEARRRVEGVIEEASAAGADVLRGTAYTGSQGHFVAPAIVRNAPASCRAVSDEIFGPVLVIDRVASIDEACGIVDGLSFALTGGIYSRNPRTIRKVAERSPVGNLYVNQGTTGAIVGRQPFGGNRLSGNGTKAGGPDYLLNFVEPLVVSENVVRHGLPL